MASYEIADLLPGPYPLPVPYWQPPEDGCLQRPYHEVQRIILHSPESYDLLRWCLRNADHVSVSDRPMFQEWVMDLRVPGSRPFRFIASHLERVESAEWPAAGEAIREALWRREDMAHGGPFGPSGWALAVDRANTLVRETIPADQYAALRRCGYVEIPSQQDPRGVYRVYRAPTLARTEYRRAGKLQAKFCVVPSKSLDAFPDGDLFLIHYLMLTADEQRFLDIAVRWPIGERQTWLRCPFRMLAENVGTRLDALIARTRERLARGARLV